MKEVETQNRLLFSEIKKLIAEAWQRSDGWQLYITGCKRSKINGGVDALYLKSGYGFIVLFVFLSSTIQKVRQKFRMS